MTGSCILGAWNRRDSSQEQACNRAMAMSVILWYVCFCIHSLTQYPHSQASVTTMMTNIRSLNRISNSASSARFFLLRVLQSSHERIFHEPTSSEQKSHGNKSLLRGSFKDFF